MTTHFPKSSIIEKHVSSPRKLMLVPSCEKSGEVGDHP